MRTLRFIYKGEKKKIMEKLEYYEITELPYLLVLSGKEKIRGYSGRLSTNELFELNREVGIEVIGMYLFHEYYDGIRLSFDAAQALSSQVTKNILEIDDKQEVEFLKGRDIALSKEDKERFKDEPRGFKIIKNKGDFIGTGNLTEDRIVNYMPKERRLR